MCVPPLRDTSLSPDAQVLLPAPAGAGGGSQRLRPHSPCRGLGGDRAPGAVGGKGVWGTLTWVCVPNLSSLTPPCPVSPPSFPGAPGFLHLGGAHGRSAAPAAAPGPLCRPAAPGCPLPRRCPQTGPATPPATLPPAAPRGGHLLRVCPPPPPQNGGDKAGGGSSGSPCWPSPLPCIPPPQVPRCQ